jgi:hypothetical protein
MATHHTRQYSSRSFPWELQISHAKKTLSHVRSSVTNNNGFWIVWLDSVMPSFTVSLNYNQLQQLTINLLPRTCPFSSSCLNSLTSFKLNYRTEVTMCSHVYSLHNLEKNWTEIATFNSFSIIVPLFVAVETCLASHCLAIYISAVLLWLYTSGLQASCHSILGNIN